MKELRSASDDAVASFLSTTEMFSAFTPQELQQLSVHADSRWFDFGETVFEQGQKCTGVYVIRSGAVRIFGDDQGKEISVGVRKAGDVLAEIGALREHKHDT
jgi:ATP-binding cassette, subfamily B, bacterial HlyB/CyaB